MSFGFSNFQLPNNAVNWVTSGPATNNAGLAVTNTANQIGNIDWGSSGGWDWLGKNGILPTAFMGLQTLGGLANVYNGFQQLDLARNQYNLAKNVANANLNNSVENYYNAIKSANRVGYALQGGYAKNAYGADNQELAATKAADEATKNLTRHV